MTAPSSRLLRSLALAAAALAAPLLVAATGAGDSLDAGPPAADGGPDGDADGGPDGGPPLPALDADPFPEARSPMPKAPEWSAAPEVAIHRWSRALFAARAGEKSTCHARRLREWVRVDCTTAGGVLLLGGTTDGIWLTDASATFPVRRGDRREIEFLEEEATFSGYHAMDEHHVSTFRFTLSEQWIAGEERPWVAAD